MMQTAAITIHLSPLLPAPLTAAMIASVLLLTAVSFFIFRRGLLGRVFVALSFLLVLLNPSLMEEQREPVKDTAVVVLDRSPSQSFGDRTATSDNIMATLQSEFKDMEDIDLRIVSAGEKRETRLFEALDRALADIPAQRRAGVILVTDGQVHDVPEDPEKRRDYGPVHVLLTGERHETDRQLVMLEAPSYGIVDQTITVRYRIEDHGSTPGQNDMATVVIRGDEKPEMTVVPVDTDQTATLPIRHAGQNVFEIEASPVEDEITTVNNRMPLLVNGVRDRLKVLLVSGRPYPGERTWRDLLTSDPGVDLVHFTILREPEKVDITPQNELSLIAFPFRELFEVKLYDFDLIIFDQYSLNRILPNYYFANIARYVQEGGALLEASGPSFAGTDSIYTTELKDILPAFPTGSVMEAAYTPALTDLGKRHPVTQNLNWGPAKSGTGKWGPWMRQIAVQPKEGDVIMSGLQSQPLLILDHVGKGRVAQLASDQIWLWSRGFMGGGPQAELLRRLAHWLMKEPELEENALDIVSDQSSLLIRRRNLHDAAAKVTLKAPDGSTQDIALKEGRDGWLEFRVPAPLSGIYSVDDGLQRRFAIVGEANPPEWRSVVTTDSILQSLVTETGGQIAWVPAEGVPNIRRVSHTNHSFSGSGWMGLRDNDAYSVTGVRDIPFLPPWFSAALLLAMAIAAWWFEGRSGRDRRRIRR